MFLMKRKASIIIAAFFLLAIYSCGNKVGEDHSETPVVVKSRNSDSFNLAFDTVLVNYNALKDAFIDWDTAVINKSASALQLAVISVPYTELHDDASATKATSIAQNAADGLQTLLSVDSISDKRRFFYTVSESIYNLIKTAAYDKAVIYHKKCPMAFNGSEDGWWFSSAKKIDNPYYGTKHPKYKNAMLECGTVEDSINNMQ